MTSNLFRIIQIIYLFLKYDVDKMLVDSDIVSNKKYFYILPWNWFRRKPVKNIPEKIRSMLEELGPIFVKLGQVISTRKDLLAEPIAKELSKLQDHVKPFPAEVSKSIVESELKSKITDIFQSFTTEPLASASIAQVHEAKLKDGSDIIVKVVRPGIKKEIEKDLLLMKRIAKYLTSLSDEFKRMHLIEIVNDYEILVYDETDLIKEAANAKKIKKNFLNSELIYIPEIYSEYLTKNILVMERTFATPINNKDELKEQGINFKQLAENAIEIFFIQVFEHNFFHADMHPGNIFIQKNGDNVQFVLVDFGIMGSLSKFDKKYLAENFVAFFNKDYEKVARLHVECEWVPRNTNILLLEKAIRDNCESMLDKQIKDVSLSDIIIGLFDTARRFKLEVQPQLVLMQKALLYTEGIGREFYSELDLWKTSKPILEKWMKKQKGISAVMRKLKYNSSDLLEILPELPATIRRLVNIINNNEFDINSNLKQLKVIEEKIKKNTLKNYWYFSIFLFLIPPTMITALFTIFDKLHYLGNFLLPYIIVVSLLILYSKPKR